MKPLSCLWYIHLSVITHVFCINFQIPSSTCFYVTRREARSGRLAGSRPTMWSCWAAVPGPRPTTRWSAAASPPQLYRRWVVHLCHLIQLQWGQTIIMIGLHVLSLKTKGFLPAQSLLFFLYIQLNFVKANFIKTNNSLRRSESLVLLILTKIQLFKSKYLCQTFYVSNHILRSRSGVFFIKSNG